MQIGRRELKCSTERMATSWSTSRIWASKCTMILCHLVAVPLLVRIIKISTKFLWMDKNTSFESSCKVGGVCWAQILRIDLGLGLAGGDSAFASASISVVDELCMLGPEDVADSIDVFILSTSVTIVKSIFSSFGNLRWYFDPRRDKICPATCISVSLMSMVLKMLLAAELSCLLEIWWWKTVDSTCFIILWHHGDLIGVSHTIVAKSALPNGGKSQRETVVKSLKQPFFWQCWAVVGRYCGVLQCGSIPAYCCELDAQGMIFVLPCLWFGEKFVIAFPILKCLGKFKQWREWAAFYLYNFLCGGVLHW